MQMLGYRWWLTAFAILLALDADACTMTIYTHIKFILYKKKKQKRIPTLLLNTFLNFTKII